MLAVVGLINSILVDGKTFWTVNCICRFNLDPRALNATGEEYVAGILNFFESGDSSHSIVDTTCFFSILKEIGGVGNDAKITTLTSTCCYGCRNTGC